MLFFMKKHHDVLGLIFGNIVENLTFRANLSYIHLPTFLIMYNFLLQKWQTIFNVQMLYCCENSSN